MYRRGMCIEMCMHTLNDSTCFAFILSFSLPLLSLQLRLCPYYFTPAVAPQSPPHLPGFYISLAPILWGHWSKWAFILSLFCSMAYNGFPLFYCIESKFLGLVFKAYYWFVLPTFSLHNLFSHYSSLCAAAKQLYLSTCTYGLLISVPVNTCYFSLLIHAYLSLQDPS